jgi:quaternary ammonium compound-resistance protein SugE
MTWIILVLAGLLEVAWAVGLKYTEGFSRPLPTVLTLAAMAASVGLLGLALRHLPLGTVAVLGEPASPLRLLCIGMIVGGIVGLKLSTA